MPIYEFECQVCGDVFEMLRTINANDQGIKCPNCGGEDIQRVTSLFSCGNSNSPSCNVNIPT